MLCIGHTLANFQSNRRWAFGVINDYVYVFDILTTHPVREQGEKLTEIYQKSECSFHVAYGLNFHFPKKLNFFIDRKNFYGLYRRGYILHFLPKVLKNRG